jgi:hypothetical protein
MAPKAVKDGEEKRDGNVPTIEVSNSDSDTAKIISASTMPQKMKTYCR